MTPNERDKLRNRMIAELRCEVLLLHRIVAFMYQSLTVRDPLLREGFDLFIERLDVPYEQRSDEMIEIFETARGRFLGELAKARALAEKQNRRNDVSKP